MEIEYARCTVPQELLPEMVAAYWDLPSWKQKAYWVDLLQDRMDPLLRPVLLDILRAPEPGFTGPIPLARAVAFVPSAWRF